MKKTTTNIEINTETEDKATTYLYASQFISNYFILVFSIPGLFKNWFRKTFIPTDHLAFLFIFSNEMFSFFTGYIKIRAGINSKIDFLLSSLSIRSAIFTSILYSCEFSPVIFYMIKIMITFRDFICTLPDSFDEKMKDLNVPLDELARKILQSSLYHEIISVMDLIHLSILFISSIIKFNLRLLLASLYYGFVFIPLLYYKNIGHRKVWKKLNAKLTEFGFNNRTIGKYVMKAVESFDHVTDVAELFVPQSILNKN